MSNLGSLLVSIVIPVYNVEQYVDRCVESIVSQTYKNLEIILVDDGSTDSSGVKCDEWKLKDKRIRVFHKDNGGLSDARNYGIIAAKGKYIVFVDSDDYMLSDFVSDAMRVALKTNTRIVMTGPYHQEEGKECVMGERPSLNCKVYSSEQTIKNICLHKDGSTPAWGKLYDISLFKETKFPKGHIYEDIYIMADLIMKAGKIAYINKKYYVYVLRKGSITSDSSFFKVDQLIESYRSFGRVCKKVNTNLDLYVAVGLSAEIINNVFRVAISSGCYFETYQYCRKKLIDTWKLALRCKEMKYQTRIKIFAAIVNPIFLKHLLNYRSNK